MRSAGAIADVELRILALREGGHPVELTLNHDREYEGGRLDPAQLPAPFPMETFGSRLFRWLVGDERLRSAWAEIRGQHPRRRIRLRIDAAAPALHALPWELLREETGLPGSPIRDLAATVDTPFSRYLAGAWRPGEPVLARPLRVLVAIADPPSLAPEEQIDRAGEIARIHAAPDDQGLPVEVVVMDEPCTLGALEAKLREGFHVLHFVGHGAFSRERRQAALLLAADDPADPDGIRYARDDEIAALFARVIPAAGDERESPLRLVFLMSCETARRDTGDVFRGLAPSLVAAGVPAVVAMQDMVPRATAHKFAEVFYPQLLLHGEVDLAMNEARSQLLTSRQPAGLHGTPAHAIPCLFMRLREGRLLGTRGQLAAEVERSFWPFLLDNLKRGRCVPFLGPRLRAGLLPAPEAIAAELAARFDYPLPDTNDLVRVAQFISLHDPGGLRANYRECLARGLYAQLGRKPTPGEEDSFATTRLEDQTTKLGWADAVLAAQETTVYHQLAELELPLYLTTGPDPLLEAALRRRGKEVRSLEPRWEAQAGTPQWLIEPPPDRKSPVVFHLDGIAGDDAQLEHLVLTEDDFLAHLVRLSRDQDRLLPMNLIKALSTGAFLFLGYDPTDWSFRVLLQGLLKSMAQTGKRMFVGVQLDIGDDNRRQRAQDYLSRYLGQYRIDVYWGTTRQFVADLLDRWRLHRKSAP